MGGTHTEMTPEYARNLERGLNYQHWVQKMYPEIYKGRTITYYEGKENQLRGESLEGIEVKLDDKIYEYCETGRLYIEMEEKSRVENDKYVESGIYRNDNTKIWLIGDYTIWFLFSKQKLIWLARLDPPFLFRPKPTGTSIGFCIPIKNAKELCLDYVEFSSEKTLF